MKDPNNYSAWKDCNEGRLRVKYDDWKEINATDICLYPGTYQSFDDFCMGQWQCREII
jgi:hypothetical protein